ncbi:hypothetical protein GCM10009780_26320 [Actinomadura alba]
MAPDAEMAAGKVCDDRGQCQDSAVLAGMEWAATEVDAKVVNMSLGGTDFPGIDPLEQAVDTLTERTGALFVISARNSGRGTPPGVSSPGSADAALAVGAVDRSDMLAGFSSTGPRVGDHAVKPDLTAPGVQITAAANGTAESPYAVKSGTSMAAPHVAGAAAILAQRDPGWGAAQIKAALMNAAEPASGSSVYQQGAGRLEVARAVEQTVTTTEANLSTYLRYPSRDAVKRPVTYHNAGTEPVTLKLEVNAAENGGGTAPEALFALSAQTVTVPAGGSAAADITVDPTVHRRTPRPQPASRDPSLPASPPSGSQHTGNAADDSVADGPIPLPWQP